MRRRIALMSMETPRGGSKLFSFPKQKRKKGWSIWKNVTRKGGKISLIETSAKVGMPSIKAAKAGHGHAKAFRLRHLPQRAKGTIYEKARWI